jgi:hypothetical protein
LIYAKIVIDKSISKKKTTHIVPINQYQKIIFCMQLDSFQMITIYLALTKKKYKAKKI